MPAGAVPAAPRPLPGPPAAPLTSAADAAPPAVPPAVAAALAALEGVADRPLEEHVDVYDEVHRRLQDALASLDER